MALYDVLITTGRARAPGGWDRLPAAYRHAGKQWSSARWFPTPAALHHESLSTLAGYRALVCPALRSAYRGTF